VYTNSTSRNGGTNTGGGGGASVSGTVNGYGGSGIVIITW
jgi:hypothetical protein